MRSPTGASRATSPLILAALAALTAATLSANLLYLVQVQGCKPSLVACGLGSGSWAMPDSVGYVRLARQIRSEGLTSVTFENRTPGYPLLLAGSLTLTGAVTPALWIAIPLGALAAAALAWIAGAISGQRSAALATGVLFSVWSNVHAMSAMLLTDALHAFLAAAGLASALAWRSSQRPEWAVASALAWMLTQSLRPTFFPVALLLAILLFVRGAPARRNRITAALCVATLLIPIAVVTSNWVRLGLAGPSTKLAYAAACESVPQLKKRLGVAKHRQAREECRLRQRDLSPAERVRTQNAEALRYFSAFPLETAKMLVASLGKQLLYPTHLVYSEVHVHLYPSWAVMRSHMLAVYWIAAFAGLVLLWQRDPRLAFFILGSFALIMLPSTLIHTAGARYRLPAEILCLPLAAMFGDAALRSLLARWRARRASIIGGVE